MGKGKRTKRQEKRERRIGRVIPTLLFWSCTCCGKTEKVVVPPESYDLYERIAKVSEKLSLCVIKGMPSIQLMLVPELRHMTVVALRDMEVNGKQSRFVSSSDTVTGQVVSPEPVFAAPADGRVH